MKIKGNLKNTNLSNIKYLLILALLLTYSSSAFSASPLLCNSVFLNPTVRIESKPSKKFIQSIESQLSQTTMQKMKRLQLKTEVVVETLRFALDSLEAFPPDRFFMINYGLPTTLMSALLERLLPQKLAPTYFVDLPMISSRFYIWDLDYSKSGAIVRNEQDLERRQRIETLFDTVLPQLAHLGGRKLVLTRALQASGQIHHFIPAFNTYLESKFPNAHLHFNFIVEEDNYLTDLHTRFPRKIWPLMGTWTYSVNKDLDLQLVGRSYYGNSFQFFSKNQPFRMTDAVENQNFRIHSNSEKYAVLTSILDEILPLILPSFESHPAFRWFQPNH